MLLAGLWAAGAAVVGALCLTLGFLVTFLWIVVGGLGVVITAGTLRLGGVTGAAVAVVGLGILLLGADEMPETMFFNVGLMEFGGIVTTATGGSSSENVGGVFVITGTGDKVVTLGRGRRRELESVGDPTGLTVIPVLDPGSCQLHTVS